MSAEQRLNIFVRPFRVGDEENLIHVFRETADEVLRNAGDPALHFAGFVWCRPYYILAADTCFVLDDGTGTAVGYIIGTSDTQAFVHRWHEKYLPHLEEQGIAKPMAGEDIGWGENLPNALRSLAHSPDLLLHDNHPSLLQQYPAHLHIDVLPDYQHKGMGRALVEAFLKELRKKGASGLHLGMNVSNDNAMKFYQRVGFERFSHVLDGGKSGESGRDGTTIYMVASL